MQYSIMISGSCNRVQCLNSLQQALALPAFACADRCTIIAFRRTNADCRCEVEDTQEQEEASCQLQGEEHQAAEDEAGHYSSN